MGISVVLLAYKEEENLKILLPQIIENVNKTGEDYEILVIDTEKPTDNTEGVCKKYGAVYINQELPGFAGAFKTGIKYAKFDKFLIMDSDGSHDPTRIPAIHELFVSGNYDLVIGSRYVKGGKTNDAKTSIVMSKILNTVFRISLGIKAKDISTDFRMYKTELLKQVELTATNYDVLEEVLMRIKLIKPDFKIGEVPINFCKRMYGESKRRLLPFIISYIKTLFFLLCLRIGKTDERATAIRNFVLYGIFGVLGMAVDYGTFAIFNVCSLGKIPEIANIVGSVCGFIFTFLMNSFLNFKKTDKLFRRFLSYGSVCVVGMIVTTTAIRFLKSLMNVYLLKAIVMIVVCFLQFIFNKLVTYRK